MGLKTNNYNIKDINVTIPEAYAQITHVYVGVDGVASATFAVQQSRDMIMTNEAIETKNIRCTINKEQPIYSQIYIKAKEELFKGWEDDIVES